MAGILIVDDDPTIRTMFARALKSVGEVETAANGAEALRLLGAKKYGIVLLDLHMPVLDGFTLLQTLSSKPGPNRDTPIYVITADTSEQARLRALRRRALFLLTKPVPIVTLTGLVDAALKKAAARAGEAVPEPAPHGADDVDGLEDVGPPESPKPAPAPAGEAPRTPPPRSPPPASPRRLPKKPG
jgi:CheY-like chemotaxis protein